MRLNKGTIICALFLLAQQSYAIDFSEADKLWEKRGEGSATIHKARMLYEKGLNSNNVNEKIYAVERLGKLAYFEGELLLGEDEDSAGEREEIFQQCLDYAKTISKENIGKETAAYYFWHASCLGLWGKAVGSFRAAWRVKELKEALQKTIQLDAAYDGGGAYRVAAAIYIKSRMLSMLGLYDPDKALDHINKAIAINPNYYVVFLIKAQVFVEKDNSAEAKKLLTEKIKELEQRIARGDSPKGFEPESAIYLQQMKNMLADL